MPSPKIKVFQYMYGDHAYFPYSEKINRHYCHRHGYDYHVDHTPPRPDRHVVWQKIPGILQEFSHCDYLLVLDADAVFYSHEFTIEEELLPLLEGNDLLMAQDVVSESVRWNPGKPNAGVIFMRVNEKVHTFLESWNKASEEDESTRWNWPPMQLALWNVVLPRYPGFVKVLEDYYLLQGRYGTFIRHFQSLSNEERTFEMREICRRKKIGLPEAISAETALPRLSVCCSTYNRPDLLGEVIESFQRQTYPPSHRELIILDDSGQYGHLRGENWQIVSFPRRYASLGEKRNACMLLSSPEFTHLVVCDDDDIYLPHWLSSHAQCFQRGARWSFAGNAYWSEENRITGRWHYQNDTFLMHPGHAFEKKLFWEMGGYPPLAGYEDFKLFQQLLLKGIDHVDALEGKSPPFLIYRRFSKEKHMTCVPLETYQKNMTPILEHATLHVGWKRDYLADVTTYDRENPKC